jgi:hypothetical protein
VSQTHRRFIPVDDETPKLATVPTAAEEQQARAYQQWLHLAFRALSLRAATAVTNLFSLTLVALVAALLARILEDPTPNRLTGVGGFAVFCLLIDIVRRRGK